MNYLPNTMTGPQALEPGNNFDYVVPYPYCSNIRINGGKLEPYLSVLSTMSIDAAVEVWKSQPESKIVIPGESPFGRPDTTDLMMDRAKLTSDINDDSFIPLHEIKDGRGLNNTYLQSQGLSEVFDGNASGMLALTLRYHAPRVQSALKAFDMSPVFATVESILHARGITEFDRYLTVIDGLKRTELIARLMTNGIGAPKGIVPNLLVKLGGPRIVDVIENDDGELILEQDSARKKQARLKRSQLDLVSL